MLSHEQDYVGAAKLLQCVHLVRCIRNHCLLSRHYFSVGLSMPTTDTAITPTDQHHQRHHWLTQQKINSTAEN